MRFQARHSRNSHDWSYELDDTGRHVFVENGGVRKRCKLIITGLGKHGSFTKDSGAEYLRKFDESYTKHDLPAVFRQLTKHGIVQNKRGTYVLTSKGVDIWRNIEKVWI
jgi:hypothetical protein